MPTQLIDTRVRVLQSKNVPPEVLQVLPLHLGMGTVVVVDVDGEVRVVEVEDEDDKDVLVLLVIVLVEVSVVVVVVLVVVVVDCDVVDTPVVQFFPLFVGDEKPGWQAHVYVVDMSR